MRGILHKGLWVILGTFIACVLMLTRAHVGTAQDKPVAKPAEAGAGAAHYTVVVTEGHNLLVTNNQTNTLYFYTINPDEKIGSDLHLRGSIDLAQVGKPTIKLTTVKPPAKAKDEK
jgi:hypothetical protein